MTDHDRQCLERFIEQMGLSLQEDGWPRIAGRMFALFLLQGGPLSFQDLAEMLSISRGSVSTNARLLRGLGLIERVSRPGDRRDYYRLAEEPYARLLAGYVARMRERRAIVTEAQAALSVEAAEERRRLGDIQTFYEVAIDAIGDLAERVRERSS